MTSRGIFTRRPVPRKSCRHLVDVLDARGSETRPRGRVDSRTISIPTVDTPIATR
jgi:hypothetical protein